MIENPNDLTPLQIPDSPKKAGSISNKLDSRIKEAEKRIERNRHFFSQFSNVSKYPNSNEPNKKIEEKKQIIFESIQELRNSFNLRNYQSVQIEKDYMEKGVTSNYVPLTEPNENNFTMNKFEMKGETIRKTLRETTPKKLKINDPISQSVQIEIQKKLSPHKCIQSEIHKIMNMEEVKEKLAKKEEEIKNYMHSKTMYYQPEENKKLSSLNSSGLKLSNLNSDSKAKQKLVQSSFLNQSGSKNNYFEVERTSIKKNKEDQEIDNIILNASHLTKSNLAESHMLKDNLSLKDNMFGSSLNFDSSNKKSVKDYYFQESFGLKEVDKVYYKELERILTDQKNYKPFKASQNKNTSFDKQTKTRQGKGQTDKKTKITTKKEINVINFDVGRKKGSSFYHEKTNKNQSPKKHILDSAKKIEQIKKKLNESSDPSKNIYDIVLKHMIK